MIVLAEDYCQCGDGVPITWLHTCDGCGKRYLFPRGRKRILHPLPFEEAKKILVEILERDQECQHWRGIPDVERSEAFGKLLDAGFLSIHSGYFLLGCGVFCNPRYHMAELYFVRRGGAELWKELKYKDARYSLNVCRKVKNSR